jgi:hypothetical protein
VSPRDNIVMDLLTPYVFSGDGEIKEVRMKGGLLGHWAVWTCAGVELLNANAVCFDAANRFAGCIVGLGSPPMCDGDNPERLWL